MNAVSRAAGAPVTQFPLTAERVLAALKGRSSSYPSPPLGERVALRAETLASSDEARAERG